MSMQNRNNNKFTVTATYRGTFRLNIIDKSVPIITIEGITSKKRIDSKSMSQFLFLINTSSMRLATETGAIADILRKIRDRLSKYQCNCPCGVVVIVGLAVGGDDGCLRPNASAITSRTL